MMQVGTNQSATYHSQPSISASTGQTGRSSSTSRQQQSQYDSEQLANIRPRLCTLRKWPHYDGYGVHLARNQHWQGLRIGDVEPNSPAESGGLLREDVVLAVNGRLVENDDFFAILSFIQQELEAEQIRFLVIDPQSADLARRHHLIIDETYRTCVRMETPTLTVSPEKILYDQWRTTNTFDPAATHNTIRLGPTVSINQNQPNANMERGQPKTSGESRDEVYTFPSYSHYALENGRSFFDVLYGESVDSSSTQRQQQEQQQPERIIEHSTARNATDTADVNDKDNTKDKKSGSTIGDGVKNLIKSGFDNLKSVLPTNRHDTIDKDDNSDGKRKPSIESIEHTPDTPESPSLLDKFKNKFKRSTSPTNTNDQGKKQLPYDHLRQTSHQPEDTDNTTRPEPRVCSLTLRPGIDTIGISLQPDKDFGHIIKQVDPNSLAARAGIQSDDCIMTLNDTSLLNVPYDDVLTILKKSRNDTNLNFLVAKKSYLLKSCQNSSTLVNIQHDSLDKDTDTKPSTSGEVMPSSNISTKPSSSVLPATEALEQLYNKYSNEQRSSFDEPPTVYRPRETVSTTTTTTTTGERYDRLIPQMDHDQYSTKQQQPGQILRGVGPAIADRTSWGVSGEKTADDLSAPISGDSSTRSNTRSRQPDVNDTQGRDSSLGDAFKPLQVGITNPTPIHQSGNISPNVPTNVLVDDVQRISRPASSLEHHDSSSRVLPSSNTVPISTVDDRASPSSSKPNSIMQKLQDAVPLAPVTTLSTTRDYEEVVTPPSSPAAQPALHLGPTKAMSVVSKTLKTQTPVVAFEDTDDDDLSDISENSHEDENSDSIVNKTGPHTITGATIHDKTDNSLSTPTIAILQPNSRSNSEDKTKSPDEGSNEPRVLTGRSSDVDQQSTLPATSPRTIVHARRLEPSDSEDTTSGADSHVAKQSTSEMFYSPDESVDDGDDLDDNKSNTSHQHTPTNIDQSRPADKIQAISPTKSFDELEKHANITKQDDTDDEQESSADSSSTESQTIPALTGKMAFATVPILQLKDHGYELHNIQLMQPTETSPVGLKLTKQQDPLQYVITAVATGTKADLAGLKVNDWLIKIDDKDIRLLEFAEVSQDIRQLLTNAGLINMVIARKTSTTSPPIKPADKQQTSVAPSRSESMNRSQEGRMPTSLLTTDITRDTPNNEQVRFVAEQPTSSSSKHQLRSPVATTRGVNANAPGAPLSVGLTNPRSDETMTTSPRSQSQSPRRSPTREYTFNQVSKSVLVAQTSDDIDQSEIRHIVLKEALGLDFNSFIPESDSQVQTHFISNVQSSSLADKAGLRDGDRILTINGVNITNALHEDVRRMMQSKKPLQLTVVNDRKYLELIESVKRNNDTKEGTREKLSSLPPDAEAAEQQGSSGKRDLKGRVRAPILSAKSDSGSDSNLLRPKSVSPKPIEEDLSKYLQNIFVDDKGQVQVKHCLLKKDSTYNGYGLLLRYQNGLHLIDQVEEDSPAYSAGLREDDVILYVAKKNVEQMTHDDVKILIRKLSLSNTDIDLVLIKKTDMQRYRVYQEKHPIDWKPIAQETNVVQTQQQESSVTHTSNESTSDPRRSSASVSSSSFSKPPAPLPPPSTSSHIPAGARLCILQPSPERTAGFALSGKVPAPFIICQIEKNSPAEKAGLLLNDALLSINGKSVLETTYEDTVKLVKEGLQQKSVELIVRGPVLSQLNDNKDNSDRIKMGSGSSLANEQARFSMGSMDSTNIGTNSGSMGGGTESDHRGTNAVEEYQKQRNKELSHTLRLCHLHPTNGDGTQAATFGFELSEDPEYEYPLILRVEPQSPAEGAGLQSRDMLLRINERKTKGLGYDKVKKEIEKAKRDGRLEMLVVDQETFDYCKRTKKPMKEPEMKVKHIFPKSRSSGSFHKLALAAAGSSVSPRDSVGQLSNSPTNIDVSIPTYNPLTTSSGVVGGSGGYHLSTSQEIDSEDEEDGKETRNEQRTSPIIKPQVAPTRNSQPIVNFDISTPAHTHATPSAISHESPLKFFDPAQSTSEQRGVSSTGSPRGSSASQSTSSIQQTPTRTASKDSKGSKTKALPNAINSLFHKIGHSKSSKPDQDASRKTIVSSKARAPSPPTVRAGHNRLEVPRVSQSLDTAEISPVNPSASSIHDTVRSTISTGSFDYIRGPRRCVLRVDRNKGLGFVLSATGDYDHTITAVEKYSAADIAGLQVNDEVLEINDVDVRNVKYEQVVEMLVTAMRTNDTIEMRVIDGRSRNVYTSTVEADKSTNSHSLLNSNNNNNNNNNSVTTATIHSQRTTVASGDDLSDLNSLTSPFDSVNQQKIAKSDPNLPGQLKQFDKVSNRALSGSVPTLATGITASPHVIHPNKSISTSSEKGSMTKLSDISTQEAPVARLCRIRKFPSSPFYGFFLCGDPKKLGRVFISDVTKHSPAAVCGLRDSDRIIEINGSSTETLTYETILDKIKQHMARDDLELLVLDKKSIHWYRERNYPITSRTLPTIIHIEPIINDSNTETQFSEVPMTNTKMVGFADRRVSKTGL